MKVHHIVCSHLKILSDLIYILHSIYILLSRSVWQHLISKNLWNKTLKHSIVIEQDNSLGLLPTWYIQWWKRTCICFCGCVVCVVVVVGSVLSRVPRAWLLTTDVIIYSIYKTMYVQNRKIWGETNAVTTTCEMFHCITVSNIIKLNKHTVPVHYTEYRQAVTHCCQVYHVRL